MLSSGIPTLLNTRNLQDFVTQAKSRLDEARVEAVTGLSADVAKTMGGDIGRIEQIQKFIDDTGRYDAVLSETANDFSIVQTTLGTIRDRVGSLATQVTAAQGVDNQTQLKALEAEAENELRSILSIINTPFGGRQLFSGDETKTAPIADVDALIGGIKATMTSAASGGSAAVSAALDTFFDDAAGPYLTTHYQGGTNDAPTREVAPGRRLGVEIRADDPMIRDTIRGLATLAFGTSANIAEESRDALYTEASLRLGLASEKIVSEQTAMGAKEAEIETLQARNSAVRSRYELALNNLIGVDQYEATTLMTNIETQLQASYLATARIQSLSLVNFLR